MFLKKIFERFEQNKSTVEKPDFKNFPIYIISYNRLEYLKRLVEALENKGYTNLHILDNKSTYPPLLDYYKSINYEVHYLGENYGHMAFWKCGKFDEVIKNQYYVVTDSDVLPVEACPDDFIEIFYEVLNKNPKFTKVGFSLKYDDIPDVNIQKEFIQVWEAQFYDYYCFYKYKNNKIKIYDADIDTTFALYRPCEDFASKDFYSAIRIDYPYQLRHLPWYKDTKNKSEEDIYYINSVKSDISHYSVDITSEELFKETIFYDKSLKRFNRNLSHTFDFVEKFFSIKKQYSNFKVYLIIKFFGIKLQFKLKKMEKGYKKQ